MQWDTSEHDWLEGRGDEQLYLISMIDDATSRLFARFVRQRFDRGKHVDAVGLPEVVSGGRWRSIPTRRVCFETARNAGGTSRGWSKDPAEMPPTQIGRALRELDITWIAAHSPQAKGRVERSFDTAQDRLVKGMRVAGVKTFEQANEYLEKEFLPWWNRTLAVEAGQRRRRASGAWTSATIWRRF